MSAPSAEDVIDAFIDLVREQLAEGNTIEVPSLGTFSVEHHSSEPKEEDGTRSLSPPRNVVLFEPDQN